MSIASPPLASLSRSDLVVEAGAAIETVVEIRSAIGEPVDTFEECTLRVRDLPDGWYTLSTERLRVPAGGSGQALLAIHPPHDDPSAALGEHPFTVEVTPDSGGVVELSARLLALPPGGESLQSRLLEYLPAVYRGDPFIARFLLIFQSIIDPIERTIDYTHHYLDPDLTPARFLPWLASWVGIELDPALDEASQRELVRRAVELHRWKGTRRALREELRIRTGARALIAENFDGMRLGQDACLGLNTNLGVRRDHCIAVTLAAGPESTVEQRQADAVVQELKPAHVGHVVRIVPAPRSPRGGDNG